MASVLSSGTTTNQGGEEETRLELPPGFRFHPTDEELIMSYLRTRQATLNSSFPCPAVADVDIYNFDPWDLPSRAKMHDKECYFFSNKDRKYPTGMRTNRATASSGYWKATGKGKEIFSDHRALVGMKKTLVSYTGRAPIEHQTGIDVSDSTAYSALQDQDEPDQFRCSRFIIPTFPPIRHLLLEFWKNQRDSAHDDHGLNMATPKEEEDSVHCSVRAPRAFLRDPAHDEKDSLHCSSVRQHRQPVRFSTGDILDNMLALDTRLRIAVSCAEALAYMHSKIVSIDHTDLKPSNILLDSKMEPDISDFGLSRLLHAVPTHNRPVDAKFSGKPSAKRDIEKKIGSHMTHWPRYLSVHHHPLIKCCRLLASGPVIYLPAVQD